jgi:hypothetical protein
MGTRNYTITNLKAFLKFANNYAMENKVPYFLNFFPRNGYQAIDLTRIDLDGSLCTLSAYQCGTSKECFFSAENFCENLDGREPLKKATRHQAKRMLMIAGLNFDLDFFQQRYGHQLLLTEYAKLTKYRRPSNPNGSLARYFFNHLQTKIKL